MRPLCGAIISAGALIGLGLFSMSYGTRYADYGQRDAKGHFDWESSVKITHIDHTLLFVLVLLTATLIIGLAIAFVGLAYHHHKRHLEHLHLHGDRTTPALPR